MIPLRLAFSPCPNDTFLFHAFVKKLIPHPFALETSLLDIQHLNEGVLAGIPDLSKISFFTLGHILDSYCLLTRGSALGFANGPKIVTGQKGKTIDDLKYGSLGIPGPNTTAYLLYRLMMPAAKKEEFYLYHELVHKLQTREIDFALVIHETRFTLEKEGLYEVCDLGQVWHAQTDLPLPLGCLVAKRSLGEPVIAQIDEALAQSLAYAYAHPQVSDAYILENSQEKDPAIVHAHINLYVNEETCRLSDKGMEAIRYLLRAGHELNLLPQARL